MKLWSTLKCSVISVNKLRDLQKQGWADVWFYAPAVPSANSSWVLWRKHASNSPSLNPEWNNSKRNTHKPAGGPAPASVVAARADAASGSNNQPLRQRVRSLAHTEAGRSAGCEPLWSGTVRGWFQRSDSHHRSAWTASFPLRERASGCERGERGQVLVSVKGVHKVHKDKKKYPSVNRTQLKKEDTANSG